jgi:hypothetical protein
MPYIERDENSVIKGVYRMPQGRAIEEFLPDDHPDVVEFLTPAPKVDQMALMQAKIAELEKAAVKSDPTFQVVTEQMLEPVKIG